MIELRKGVLILMMLFRELQEMQEDALNNIIVLLGTQEPVSKGHHVLTVQNLLEAVAPLGVPAATDGPAAAADL